MTYSKSDIKNFYSVLEKHKELDKEAIYDETNCISYRELNRKCNYLSGFLENKGIITGERVCILLPNSIEFAVVFFSCIKNGLITVPINPKFRKNEIEYYIGDSSPRMIFTIDRFKKTLTELDCTGTIDVIYMDRGKAASVISEVEEEFYTPPVNATDLKAIYLYSTGSTGVPKRVSRTHRNLLSLANNHSQTLGWNGSEKILFTLPISHTYALGNFISSIRSGMTVYMMEDFNRKKVVETIKKHGLTIYPAVPFILDVLAESNIDREYLASLKTVISAGAPLSLDIFTRFSKKYGIQPRQLYGSSETGVISINLDDDIVASAESVGKPVNEVIVKIVKENDEETDLMELGEIIVKSPSMTSGYDNLPEETKRVFRNGFYYTGDIGYRDSKGNIYIKGRKKLFINVSGNKVDPLEIEQLLNKHPDISESAVTGYKDASGNEYVKCYIVSRVKITGEEVVEYLRDIVADYKIPRLFVFTDSIPKSPTGKILRQGLY